MIIVDNRHVNLEHHFDCHYEGNYLTTEVFYVTIHTMYRHDMFFIVLYR